MAPFKEYLKDIKDIFGPSETVRSKQTWDRNPYRDPSHPVRCLQATVTTPAVPFSNAASPRAPSPDFLAEARLAAGRDPTTGRQARKAKSGLFRRKKNASEDQGRTSDIEREVEQGNSTSNTDSEARGRDESSAYHAARSQSLPVPRNFNARVDSSNYARFIQETKQRKRDRELAMAEPLTGYYAPPAPAPVEYYRPANRG
ncbi:hypothetical protein M011DRAFT_460990 [Sporormia fimetaria CBS 119925]|uniref:Uncharacterized protein n=1 Tax=Sporormia fimetaria CBS 119925 TaxID=1340428 RepID=A0A6A6V0X1_9PLEO|nr:hypothetical protein M011DRAFT_460990 [Sporormia fimetaria CBS 119925]